MYGFEQNMHYSGVQAAEANRTSPIKIGHIEEIIELIKLATGKVGTFFDSWVYRNPLRII